MIGNSVKSDIAPVVNIGGWAMHTPHDIVWVHEMMDMPESDRIIIVEKITDVIDFLI
jgi:putative hydrolase of the HAD superfamily